MDEKGTRPTMHALWRRGLRAKIVGWSFVPTAIILLAVALVTFFAFQSVTEELVLQRDLDVTYVSASQLAASLAEYEDRLTSLARTADVYQGDPTTQRDALERAGSRLLVFDGGVLLLDAFGTVVATEPERPEVQGQDWSNRDYYQKLVRVQVSGDRGGTVLSEVVTDGSKGADVVVMAVPVLGEENEFLGALLGMFRVDAMSTNALYGDIVKLRVGESGSTYLVDNSGRVIYHSDAERIGEDLSALPAVQQVSAGQADAIRTRNLAGNDIIAGFAPVPGTPWGLVKEETWSALTSGFKGYRNFLVFLLVLGVLVPAIVVGFGVRRITRPIADLISGAQEVARGNFGRKIGVQTGDELEELAGQFNVMSDQLQASYANMEQRVADRTRELATLNAIAGVVSRSLDLDEILAGALAETLSMLDMEAGTIYLMDPNTEVLTLQVHQGLADEFAKAVQQVGSGEGITGQAVAKGGPVVLDMAEYASAETSQRLAPTVVREGMQTLASTPLIHKGRALGALTVGTRRPRAFPPQELELLTAVGRQIGVAIENARLFAERDRRVDELAVLNQVSRAISSTLQLDELLDLIYHQVAQVMDSTNLYIALYDTAKDWISFPLYVEGDNVRREMAGRRAGQGLTEYIIRSRRPLLLPNAVESRLDELGIEAIGTPAKSYLGVPMIASDEVLGVITVQSYTTEDIYDEGHLDLLSSIAAQAAISIQNARLYERAQIELAERIRAEEELRQVSAERALRNRELTLLNRVIAATTSRLEITAALEAVCRELALAFDVPSSAAALLNDARTALTVVAEYRSGDRPSAVGIEIPVEGNPSTQYVLEHKEPLAIADAQDDLRLAPVHHLMRAQGVASLLILPLLVRDKVVGTIGMDAVARREYSTKEISLAANAAKAAAQALENAWAEEALRLTQFTVDRAADAIFWLGPDARLLDVNQAACRALGYTREELLSMTVHDLDPNLPPEVWSDHWEKVRRRGSYTLESFHRTKAGTLIPVEVNVNYLEFGGKTYHCAFVRDITERVQAEERLREAKAAADEARLAAESANRAKSAFLANMSHELRTPLNAILGFSQLMMRESLSGESGLTAEQRENLETIGRSGEHLLGLINDVLELSKIEAGRVALQKESFDFYRLLEGLEEMFRLRATGKGLVLIFDRAPDVPRYVYGDEGKLRQVLMNLLGNAVKFTREGGVTLRIGCTNHHRSVYVEVAPDELQNCCREDSHRLLFEVEDTGPGIAPDELDAVFDPFKQTESGRQSSEGTGLGMPISRQFARLMGGDLTFNSELGVGSIFKFDVPIELARAADVQVSVSERRVIGLEPGQPRYRLLVVEDREPSRRLLVKLLEPLGFLVREAVNGQEAIDTWRDWEPHLIWMDMRMPVMDGLEAARRIKATTQGQATVIVALTASAFDEDREVILSIGCDDFVRKPFREDEIFDMLVKHLGVRFQYEEEGSALAAVQIGDAEAPVTADALAALPAEWVAELRRAAIQLDGDIILTLLDQIREPYPTLANALARLVRDYRYDVLLTLTAPAENFDDR